MTDCHDPKHEEYWAELLADPTAEDSAAAAALRACPACAPLLDDMLGLAHELDASASERAAVLAEAEAMDPLPAEDAIGPLLDQFRRRDEGRQQRWRWGLAAAAAAALVVALAVGLWDDGDAPPQREDQLLHDSGTGVTGRVTVNDGVYTFSWSGPEPHPDTWLVRWAEDGEVFLSIDALEENTCTPEPTDQDKLRARPDFTWEVFLVGRDPESVFSSADAERR